MDFEREEPKCKFSIVDRPNVRQQLEYYSLIGGSIGGDMLLRYFMGAKALIVYWECEILPENDFDIEEETNPEIVDLVIWAGLEVKKFMNGLDNIPKN